MRRYNTRQKKNLPRSSCDELLREEAGEVPEIEVAERLTVGDDVMTDLGQLVARREAVRHADDSHAGVARGDGAVRRVFERDALV